MDKFVIRMMAAETVASAPVVNETRKRVAAAPPEEQPSAKKAKTRAVPAPSPKIGKNASQTETSAAALPERISKKEAKAAYAVTDGDLKRLNSEKVGSRRLYARADVLAAAVGKYGSEAAMQRAVRHSALMGHKVNGLTLTQHQRALGDSIACNLSVQKWAVAADCHTVVKCPLEVFRMLVVPNSGRVVPAAFDESTAVVVATVWGKGACNIFGASKLRAGTRMQTWQVSKMQLIYSPASEEMSIWWIMS